MQTFIPYGSDFEMNAFCLDTKRLGKQRVETYQILNAMNGLGGWRNHPATKMWAPYPDALIWYGIAICQEWIDRGYNDSMLSRFADMCGSRYQDVELPPWIDDADIVTSHRSNLIRKYPERYRLLWPDIPNDIQYVWPS